MKVVLDSTALISNFLMKGPTFRLFKWFLNNKESKLVIDGHYAENVSTDSKIIVSGSDKKIRFVRFGESFYQMVRLKLVR